MKRICILLLFATLPVILHCQVETVFVLDSSHSYYLGLGADDWIPEERKTCTYNGNGCLSERTLYRWDMEDSSWYWTDRFLFTYNDNGNLSEKLHFDSRILVTPDYDTISSDHRIVYLYDAKGNPVDSSYYWWNDKTGEWVKSMHYVISYDAYGNKTEETGSWWDPETKNWVLMQRKTYSHDMNGNKTEETIYRRKF